MPAQFISPATHYRVETVATPHSKHRAFSDVISPQAGHILWDRTPLLCGINLRIHRNSRVTKSRASRPKEILVAFIGERPFLWRALHRPRPLRKIAANKGRQTAHSLKSLRMEELQMDWLRSEDLKEEKNVTASIGIIAGEVSREVSCTVRATTTAIAYSERKRASLDSAPSGTAEAVPFPKPFRGKCESTT